MAFAPRVWQQECFSRFQEVLRSGQTTFVIEACMGAGKSAIAARLAKHLLEMPNAVDHVLVLVPWKSIQGDIEKGMLGAFGKLFGLDARSRFFTYARQAHQPIPALDATITLYQEVCNCAAIETLEWWKSKGFRFALICDEIHHTNEINGTWGEYVSKIKDLADYSIFMSGTYFRGDRNPVGCVPKDDDGRPLRDYSYTYQRGVAEKAVRSVTTRHVDATVAIYDSDRDLRYEKDLSELVGKEVAAGRKQVLDPHGEWIRHTIQTVHDELLATRLKYPDAACLYVCRPGRDNNFTREEDEAIEDKHVHLIAKQIRELTGLTPMVVTHHDEDSVGKISRFRKGKDPYLVAVNMVSEGCDIPRLRAVAFCRYTTSEMLFRQIVGRALRIQYDEATGQPLEDGTAAQIYIPTFPLLVDFAERLWTEAQAGIQQRLERICETCGKKPCECEPKLFPDPQTIWGLEHTPALDGGHMAFQGVSEIYVQAATQIIAQQPEHQHANRVQVAALLQAYDRNRSLAQGLPVTNPAEERERLRRKINRLINRLANDVYKKQYQTAYYEEIEKPFGGVKFKEILNNWPVDRLREVYERLERRITKGYRGGKAASDTEEL